MDEIYHGLTFTAKSGTALAYSDSVIVVNSFSKFFCMTGWRVGWAIFPMNFWNRWSGWRRTCISARHDRCRPAPWRPDDYPALQRNVDRYRENRDILMQGLPAEFPTNLLPATARLSLHRYQPGRHADSVTLAEAMLRGQAWPAPRASISIRSRGCATCGCPLPAAR